MLNEIHNTHYSNPILYLNLVIPILLLYFITHTITQTRYQSIPFINTVIIIYNLSNTVLFTLY
ncbi:hypothetical protein V1512DRAFT_260057 [Lipomyces arxii]|uniref:uncharacterized protein n=1 Tax=Lipomyces arxii TaxID=56418 RepID=UPI0034CD8CE6